MNFFLDRIVFLSVSLFFLQKFEYVRLSDRFFEKMMLDLGRLISWGVALGESLLRF